MYALARRSRCESKELPILNGRAVDLSSERLLNAGIVVLAAAFLVVVLAAVPTEYALAAALFVAGTVAVYRLPKISLSAIVIAGVGPTIFLMTGRLSGADPLSLGKFSLADAIMSAMLVAVVVKGFVTLPDPRSRLDVLTALLTASFCGLLAWIAFSTVRNLGPFGIHTVGQFRYSYLVLAVPAFAALFLRSAATRRQFFAFLIVFSVGVPLALLPVVGSLKGWGIGPASRFFPANVSLGLLYGWVGLLLASERGLIKLPRWLGRGLAFPVAGVLLVDSHRSVWLTGFALLIYFVVIGRMSAGTLVKLFFLAAAVVVSVLATTTILGFDATAYVVSRGSAIVNPSADVTSSWRLDLWISNLDRWWRHPWLGEGFGGYYAGNAARGVIVTVGPHSLPVQTLVSMGAIGLALIAVVMVTAGVILWKTAKAYRRSRPDSLDTLLLELGLGILVSAQMYWGSCMPSTTTLVSGWALLWRSSSEPGAPMVCAIARQRARSRRSAATQIVIPRRRHVSMTSQTRLHRQKAFALDCPPTPPADSRTGGLRVKCFNTHVQYRTPAPVVITASQGSSNLAPRYSVCSEWNPAGRAVLPAFHLNLPKPTRTRVRLLHVARETQETTDREGTCVMRDGFNQGQSRHGLKHPGII